jgi:hypothetical protein
MIISFRTAFVFVVRIFKTLWRFCVPAFHNANETKNRHHNQSVLASPADSVDDCLTPKNHTQIPYDKAREGEPKARDVEPSFPA